MAEDTGVETTNNPYIDCSLKTAQTTFSPAKNQEFETLHCVVKTHGDAGHCAYKHLLSDSDEEDSVEGNAEDNTDRQLRGNLDNTEKLVTKYVRDQRDSLALSIPDCIGELCFQFSYEATNVTFAEWDDHINHHVSVSKEGKCVDISSRTVMIFSEDGYDSGHHVWHMKCHHVYNCQALGIAEHKNVKYRYGDNIFDVSLNEQLGDRYIYAGDSGHSWRGSTESRPYVSSVIGEEEYYSKRLNLKNSRWSRGDIITVDLWMGSGRQGDDSKWTIQFFKNGKALHDPIHVVKRCKYWPIFQVYQRGKFEIIDDISTEPIYQPGDENEEETEEVEKEEESEGDDLDGIDSLAWMGW